MPLASFIGKHVAGPGAYRQSGISDVLFLTFIDDCLHPLRSTSENARFWLAWRLSSERFVAGRQRSRGLMA